jgi:quinol monooxygenase YgiN
MAVAQIDASAVANDHFIDLRELHQLPLVKPFRHSNLMLGGRCGSFGIAPPGHRRLDLRHRQEFGWCAKNICTHSIDSCRAMAQLSMAQGQWLCIRDESSAGYPGALSCFGGDCPGAAVVARTDCRAAARSGRQPQWIWREVEAVDRVVAKGVRTMPELALYVSMKARPGKEAEVAAFLEDALAVVEAEPGTSTWYALRIAPDHFAIFDTFEDEAGRKAHLDGKVAAALMARASDLLSEPLVINDIAVLAAK